MRKLTALGLLVSALSFCLSLGAQNLVPNPSFEIKSGCPSLPSQIALATGWTSPNTGSPDYDHVCGTGSTVKVPNNLWGSQAPRTGQGYGQIIAYVPTLDFREYLQIKLTQPLVSGTTYVVSFWASRGEGSRYAIQQLQAHLRSGVTAATNFATLAYVPHVSYSSVLTDSVNWTQVTGTYTATGGEDHILIGNFKSQTSMTSTQISTTGHNNSSYYIDDVSVTPLDGQLFDKNQLIGFADLPLPATTGEIDIQDANFNFCSKAEWMCKTTTPVRAVADHAGGTAYDPRYQSVWISDGNLLVEYQAKYAVTCKVRCKAVKAPRLNANALVSGLAMSDAKSRLFQLSTTADYREIATYNLSPNLKCLPRPSICSAKLGATKALATGLAYDEVNDVLYINVAKPTSTAGSFTNELLVVPASSPCKVICQKKYFTCSGAMVTGLAYDACSRLLYATDGRITQVFSMGNPKTCLMKIGKCCAKQTSPRWRGLAIMPGWTAQSFGQSCTAAPCPSCPSMQLYTQGDPSIGATFGVGIENAPVGVKSALYLKPTTCGAGFPLSYPLCGTWYASPFLLMFPITTTSGAGTCGGKTFNQAAIPNLTILCGKKFCLQGLVLCTGGGASAFGVTNALEITIAGS